MERCLGMSADSGAGATDVEGDEGVIVGTGACVADRGVPGVWRRTVLAGSPQAGAVAFDAKLQTVTNRLEGVWPGWGDGLRTSARAGPLASQREALERGPWLGGGLSAGGRVEWLVNHQMYRAL